MCYTLQVNRLNCADGTPPEKCARAPTTKERVKKIDMKKSIIKKYAKLIVRVGANVQKGQPVVVYADVDQSEFVNLVVDEAYKAGAKLVTVNWSSDKLTKLNYRHQSLKTLSTVLNWQEEKLKWMSEELPCRIHIISDDPDGLKGINMDKVQKSSQARYKITKKYSDAMENRHQWTIAAVPSKAWAKKVFPELRTSAAVEKLWNCILDTVYVSEDTDPIDVWAKVNEDFKARCDKLNSYHFDHICYKSSNGTDFTCWLMPKSRWCGGGEYDLSGRYFNPNLPTVEIFTTPQKGRAEGKVVSTKPLSYQGQLIENFWFTFKDGKVVDYGAEKGRELLEKMVTMDEGAAMIGELALVQYDSPINNQNVLYYDTLFDENASCHIALGRGFNDCVEGYESMSQKELEDMGVNDSMIHVDFMIGSKDLDITGYTANGEAVKIFENGNFVI